MAAMKNIELKNQRLEQLDRTLLIGGSDIAAVMGLSRWQTPLSLWASKTGKLKDELSNFEAMEIGKELEEYVSRKFTKKTGVKLRIDNRTFKHWSYPYMVGHIDRWVVGEDALFEAKTCSAWKEREWDGEDIPQEYVLQVNWYLGILRKKKGYIAVLIGGQKFTWKSIDFSEPLFLKQVEAARNFYEEHLLKEIPPLAVGKDNELLTSLFPESVERELELEDKEKEEFDMLLDDRSGAIESLKHCEEAISEVEAKIKQRLGEFESTKTSNYSVSWKTQHRKEHLVKASQFRKFTARRRT